MTISPKKPVAFISFQYPLGISPMIINSIELLARKGHTVEVFIDQKTFSYTPISFRNERVTFHYFKSTYSFNPLIHHFVQLLFRFTLLAKTLPIGFSLKMFYPEAFEFSKWLENKLTGKDFTYLFPIETNSLLGLHFYRPKKKIVYYNMELLDWEKENPLYAHKLFLKNLEYRMIRRIGKVVIQSHKRAQIFSKINHFNPKNILILPVTSTGDPIKKKSRYFRELFNVSKNKKIVIYAGAFAPWAQCLEIIRSVTDWPQDFVLVMHTGNPKMLKSDYFKKMQRAAQNLPVYFSTKPLEYKNLALALSSADIGLLFYEAIDNNFTKILFSSNKMSEYLKAGLPVLTSSFPELRRFVRKNKIGASIGSPAKLSQILKIIKPQLAKLSRNAQKCYQRYFRFETYFKSFYHQLFPNAKEE